MLIQGYLNSRNTLQIISLTKGKSSVSQSQKANLQSHKRQIFSFTKGKSSVNISNNQCLQMMQINNEIHLQVVLYGYGLNKASKMLNDYV